MKKSIQYLAFLAFLTLALPSKAQTTSKIPRSRAGVATKQANNTPIHVTTIATSNKLYSQTPDPIFMIDGKEVAEENWKSISPNDIASVSVIKSKDPEVADKVMITLKKQ